MKKRLWLIAAVLMCAVMAMAVSAETDGYYTYEVTDGEATITGVDVPLSESELTVPATLGGYPVTTIGLRALNDLTNVHTVEISSGIQKIEEQAFSGARYLKYVKIPDSVKQIGRFPFAMCDNLCAIEVDPENPYYTSQDDVLFSKDMTELICYPPMKADTSYIVPDEVEYFADAAFCNCHNFTSIILPENLRNMGYRCFENCDGLTSIYIPEYVDFIGGAFQSCDSLTEINVNENNPCFCSIDGVLFSIYFSIYDDVMDLIAYPAAKADETYTVPDTVMRIVSAFYNCNNLKNVILNEDLERIFSNAFVECNNITSIMIPKNVYDIGAAAFKECTLLTEINVSTENPYYYSINGVLFEKDESGIPKSLLTYPCGKTEKTYVMPDGIESISYSAFEYCENIETIVVNNELLTIGRYAFDCCKKLICIIIPANVTTIDRWAFRNCPNLTIYGYTGSTAETYANDNSIPFVALRDITLALTTYGDAADVTIQLLVDDEVIRTETVPNTTGTASFTITGVAPGSYTIRVSKPNHVSRSYSVTVQ